MICAFLTMENGKPTEDDRLAIEPLNELGCEVECHSWRADIEWSRFDAAVIRSTWDYHHHPDIFAGGLDRIAMQTMVINPVELVRWNMKKTYLHELQQLGVEVVPTIFSSGLPSPDNVLEETDGEFVVKTVIGASADDTYRLTRDEDTEEIERVFRERPCMVQPLVRSILTEGEVSLIYFLGDFSHAVLKIPRDGDFRVQGEYGGRVEPFAPGEGLEAQGRRVLDALPQTRVHPFAAQHFARAIVGFLRDRSEDNGNSGR